MGWRYGLWMYGLLFSAAVQAAEPDADDGGGRGAIGSAEVLFLGNSKVGSDLDLGDLSDSYRAAGKAAPSWARLGVGGSHGPVWYTMLADRVYTTAWRPKTLVVYGPLSHALNVNLDARALTSLLDRVQKEVPPALFPLFGGAPGPEWRRSGADVQPGCPGSDVELPSLNRPPLSEDPAQSYLLEIARAGAANGARTVFVRQPVAPGGTLVDEVSLTTENAARSALGALSGAWLDLRAAFVHPRWYGDAVHMTEAGRHHLSAALGGALAALDLVGSTPFPAVTPASAPPVVRRTGTPNWTAIAGFVAEGSGPEACGARLVLPAALVGLDDDHLRAAGLGAASPFRVMAGDKAAKHARPDPDAACDGRWTTEVGADGVAYVRVRARPGAAKRLSLVPLDPAEVTSVGPEGEQAWWVGGGLGLQIEAEAGKLEIELWSSQATTVELGGAAKPVAAGLGRLTLKHRGGALSVEVDAGYVQLRRVVTADGAVLLDAGPRTLDLLRGAYTVGATPDMKLSKVDEGPRQSRCNFLTSPSFDMRLGS